MEDPYLADGNVLDGVEGQQPPPQPGDRRRRQRFQSARVTAIPTRLRAAICCQSMGGSVGAFAEMGEWRFRPVSRNFALQGAGCPSLDSRRFGQTISCGGAKCPGFCRRRHSRGTGPPVAIGDGRGVSMGRRFRGVAPLCGGHGPRVVSPAPSRTCGGGTQGAGGRLSGYPNLAEVRGRHSTVLPVLSGLGDFAARTQASAR